MKRIVANARAIRELPNGAQFSGRNALPNQRTQTRGVGRAVQ